jgi:hypothetical protein
LKDPLGILDVIDRLDVGPVRLEPRRFFVPYKVSQKGKIDTIDLIYKFEEDVFDVEDAESRNLAEMIGIQIALNYGLFCKAIVFHGTFDSADRRFIIDMARITAREIFVKKFLEPNPFLIGEASDLPPAKYDDYLRAKITFNGSQTAEPARRRGRSWSADQSRYAVLSSGGKDSLLSFGLLNEIGYDTHPIYVNESGRHWYTALNAYRFSDRHYPNTSRVWTNADRVFNWMLRHMPFIRPDFNRLRTDEYAVRLWTLAVFIFGALPVLRKRGIGLLVIGDEYDTTRRMHYKGIPHYDGLYDQSRYFDNALSRYYQQKGWGVRQFSLIRSLSELLIEKILAERYPELQRHQVSCHATHMVGDRVRPCGRCEKCRRIVGMLMALGVNPSNCGYTKTQIAQALMVLANVQLRQDAASAQQMAFMLSKKRMVQFDPRAVLSARQHPEIMKIRFDPEKSPESEIPPELRERLVRIYLQHADTIACRRGQRWIDHGGRRSRCPL